jgi:hypothetical protein
VDKKEEVKSKKNHIHQLLIQQQYEKILQIADNLKTLMVKDVQLLLDVVCACEELKNWKKAQEYLLYVYNNKSPRGKAELFKLAEISAKLGDVEHVEAVHREYSKRWPDNPENFLIGYYVARLKENAAQECLQYLEQYCRIEWKENWQYELARLYKEVGRKDECARVCHDIILMFGFGDYMEKSIALLKECRELTEEDEQLIAEQRLKHEQVIKEQEARRQQEEAAREEARRQQEEAAREEARRQQEEAAREEARRQQEEAAREEARRQQEEAAREEARRQQEEAAREEARRQQEEAAREEARRQQEEAAREEARRQQEEAAREEARRQQEEISLKTGEKLGISDIDIPSETSMNHMETEKDVLLNNVKQKLGQMVKEVGQMYEISGNYRIAQNTISPIKTEKQEKSPETEKILEKKPKSTEETEGAEATPEIKISPIEKEDESKKVIEESESVQDEILSEEEQISKENFKVEAEEKVSHYMSPEEEIHQFLMYILRYAKESNVELDEMAYLTVSVIAAQKQRAGVSLTLTLAENMVDQAIETTRNASKRKSLLNTKVKKNHQDGKIVLTDKHFDN